MVVPFVVAFFIAVAAGNGHAVKNGYEGHDWTGINE